MRSSHGVSDNPLAVAIESSESPTDVAEPERLAFGEARWSDAAGWRRGALARGGWRGQRSGREEHGLHPGHATVRRDHARTHVAFISGERVRGGSVERFL